MSSESRLRRSLLATVLACASASCADFRRGATWDELESDDDDDASEPTGDVEAGPRFASDVHPLLFEGCAGCHEPGALDYVVTDDIEQSHQATLRFVDLDDPASSRLLHKSRGDGHGGGTIYGRTTDEYAVILSWIEQGAVP